MTSISSVNIGGSVVLQRNTPQYYENLKQFFNKEEVKRYPSEIHVVESSQQVANALKRAQQLGVSVGVRSGGHLPSKPSLIQDGILIDVSRLNRQVVYDEKTHQVAFGPAVRVFEAWELPIPLADSSLSDMHQTLLWVGFALPGVKDSL